MSDDGGSHAVAQHHLWVTRQALEDIGFGALAGPSFDLARYAGRHPILGRFLDQRSQNVLGTQPTRGVQATKVEIYNLHAQNPIRGVTWFDRTANTVFLLAVVLDHEYTVFQLERTPAHFYRRIRTTPTSRFTSTRSSA